jgi:hypothetical protein
LAITAIAAGAYLIYKNWDTIGPYFSGLWQELKAGFSGGLGGMATTILNFSPIGLFYRAFAGVMGYFGVDMPAKFSEFGGMLISGLVNGITNAMGSVKTAITGAGDSTIGWFKEKLGIHSPSRVFAQLGGYTMAGLSQGIENGQGGPLTAVANLGKQLVTAGALSIGIGSGGAIAMDSSAPLTANNATAAAPITINVYSAPGQDAAAIGREVQRQLAAAQQQQQARQRGRLGDLD